MTRLRIISLSLVLLVCLVFPALPELAALEPTNDDKPSVTFLVLDGSLAQPEGQRTVRPAQSQTLIYHDHVTLISGSPDTNTSGIWTGTRNDWNLVVGYHTRSDYQAMRGLLKFDLAHRAVTPIPKHSVVTQALLRIRPYADQSTPG